jgi:hydrogenase nickel incorporation protein HypA/HybF
MHELSISRSILETALEHAVGRRVLLISMTIGALRQVVPDSLAFYFEIVSRGTVCEGARLQTRFMPARLGCACGEEWQLEDPAFRCPRCAGGRVTVLDGDELCIDSIEVEEATCTGPR